MRELMSYAWPGNVRELRNVLEQAAAISEGELVIDLPRNPRSKSIFSRTSPSANALPMADLLDKPFPEARDAALARFEKAYLLAALARHGGNVSRAAEACGVARNYLHRLMKRNGMRRASAVVADGD
jgi:DNA-binding NtrC family response regulator